MQTFSTEQLQQKYPLPTGTNPVAAPTNAGPVKMTTDQLKAKYNVSTASSSAPSAKPDILGTVSNVVNTIFPNKNIGEAIGTGLAKLAAPEDQKKYIEPSKATLGGVTGDLLGDAAWLVGGGAAAPAAEEASTLGRLGMGALKGAKAGVIGGTLSGAGNALSAGGNIVDAGVGAIKGGLAGGATGGALGGALSALPAIAGRVANKGIQSEGNIVSDLNRAGGNSSGTFDTKAMNALNKNANRANDVAGTIMQGDKSEQALGAQVLGGIDTTGIKTYEDLSKKLQSEADTQLKLVDAEHAKNPTPIKLTKLNQSIGSGIEGSALKLKVNYVKDALTQLNQFYTKTNDMGKALRVRALLSKANKTGLTPGEINGIAREHGRELNGFNANGELASGLSKQAAENTRKGVKTTARSFLNSDVAKQADQRASDILHVKKNIDDIAEKVNALAQKVEKRGIMKKLAGGVATGINIATAGAPKAFFQKLFLESNLGNKTGNYLDFEARLAKNLDILKRLNGAKDSQVEQFMRSVIGGLAQKK